MIKPTRYQRLMYRMPKRALVVLVIALSAIVLEVVYALARHYR